MTVGVSLHQVDIPYGEFTLHGTRISRVEGEASKRIPGQRGDLPARSLPDRPDPGRAVLRRDRPDPGLPAARAAGLRLPDPRVLARRRPPRRPAPGRSRRGGRAAGLAVQTIGVVGMGYVGLTMAVALARKGFTVHGVDASPAVLAALGAGRAHLFEPGVEEGLAAFLGDRLRVCRLAAGRRRRRGDDLRLHPHQSGDPRPRAREPARGGPRTWRARAAGHAGDRPLDRPGRGEPQRGAARAHRAAGARACAWPSPPSGPSRARRSASWRSCRRWWAASTPASRDAAAALFARSRGRSCRWSQLEAAELVKLVQQLPHRPDLLLRQRGGADGRAVGPRPARGDPRRQSRLPAPRPGQARLRGRRLPLEGPLHPRSSASRAAGYTPWLVGRRAGSTSTCRCAWPSGWWP